MNTALAEVIAATDAERRDVFLSTANRIGTAVENVEKDFKRMAGREEAA